jgi:hypothetical protein
MAILILVSMFALWLACLWAMLINKVNITTVPQITPERLYSEAEVVAKSIGYWEKMAKEGKTSDERVFAALNLSKAVKRLIELTGDYVPDEAKKPLVEPEPVKEKLIIEILPPGVASLAAARESKNENLHDW